MTERKQKRRVSIPGEMLRPMGEHTGNRRAIAASGASQSPAALLCRSLLSLEINLHVK
jgi:hypothetical protein